MSARRRPLHLLTLLTVGVLSGARADAAQVACEGPDGDDAWVTDFRDRVLAYNGLAAFATAEYGASLSCEGRVTMEFDGRSYGTLTVGFPDGVSLVVETQPIETSIVTLRAPAGFDDAERVEEALRAYAERVGVSIDWSRPERSAEDGASVQSFRDPEEGLNASASMATAEGRLVAVRFSMAL